MGYFKLAIAIYPQKELLISEIKYEIVQLFGVLSVSVSGWSKQLNLISWNDREMKMVTA